MNKTNSQRPAKLLPMWRSDIQLRSNLNFKVPLFGRKSRQEQCNFQFRKMFYYVTSCKAMLLTLFYLAYSSWFEGNHKDLVLSPMLDAWQGLFTQFLEWQPCHSLVIVFCLSIKRCDFSHCKIKNKNSYFGVAYLRWCKALSVGKDLFLRNLYTI